MHKEWPSHSPFSSDRGTRERRQSYDIAVLDPRDVASGSLKDLIEGRFRAPIAIELGLDYSLQHIDGDLAKLERNVVRHPYVVHFSRKRTRRATQVEESVLRAHRARTAFCPPGCRLRCLPLEGAQCQELTPTTFTAEAVPR